MRVDLPAPFSPQIPWISRSWTVSETSFRATTPGNLLVMDRISRMGSVMGPPSGWGPRHGGAPGPLGDVAEVDGTSGSASELAGLDLLLGVVAGVDHDLLVVALQHHLHVQQVGGHHLHAVVVRLGGVGRGLLPGRYLR